MAWAPRPRSAGRGDSGPGHGYHGGPVARARPHQSAARPFHRRGEAVIAGRDDQLAYIEHYAAEDDALTTAREHGRRADAAPVSTAGGAALRFLAAALDARAVVEIGTGVGYSGIWLLRGMHPDGILTSVDAVAEYQEMARTAYQRAGFASNRTRLIHGRALDVLPRLTDNAYDMVFVDAPGTDATGHFHEAARLLRPGGVVVFNDALTATTRNDGPLAAPDPHTAAMREASRLLRDDDRFLPLLLPLGEGLLAGLLER